ncbi:hypothetical protein LA080_001862 [Diaporthe eres]|nr:hypothetical protein LA080_001862 [Diaporthe eres]
MIQTEYSPKSVILTKKITEDFEICQEIMMLKKNSVPGHPGIGIRLDPDWIDIQLAGKWKQVCLEEHGMKCNNPLKISPVKPLWVVDIESQCIVPGRDRGAFVALSYRWGNHSWPRINREILNAIRNPGALATKNLAPIIRHAMTLTSAIGERYLWVDALCIVQGDNVETLNQLNLMGAFYASALITIVVADGDSEVGISGLKGVSNSRKAKQTLIPFGEETLMCPDLNILLGDYKTRGWTYQEYIMSQRRLIFAGSRMQWPEPDLILKDLPDLKSLRELMSNYNTRSFRYEEDMIPGISGLLCLFSRSFQGGFLCGLPEMFFDRALGWCASSDLRLRKPSGRPIGLLHTPRRVLLSERYVLPGTRTATPGTKTSRDHYPRVGLAKIQYLPVPEAQTIGVHRDAMITPFSTVYFQTAIGCLFFWHRATVSRRDPVSPLNWLQSIGHSFTKGTIIMITLSFQRDTVSFGWNGMMVLHTDWESDG